MTKILKITKHDLQPYYLVTAVNSDDSVIDITNATIYCTMKSVDGTLVKIDRQTDGIEITDAVNGEFRYKWQSGDTDTVGEYWIEFEINPPAAGPKFTIPSTDVEKNKAKVIVLESLDDE